MWADRLAKCVMLISSSDTNLSIIQLSYYTCNSYNIVLMMFRAIQMRVFIKLYAFLWGRTSLEQYALPLIIVGVAWRHMGCLFGISLWAMSTNLYLSAVCTVIDIFRDIGNGHETAS